MWCSLANTFRFLWFQEGRSSNPMAETLFYVSKPLSYLKVAVCHNQVGFPSPLTICSNKLKPVNTTKTSFCVLVCCCLLNERPTDPHQLFSLSWQNNVALLQACIDTLKSN